MGGFFSISIGHGPLLATVLLFSSATPYVWGCDDQLDPTTFTGPLPGGTRLLPNGMMAIQYSNHGDPPHIHISVHRVVMVIPGLQAMLPENLDPRYTTVHTDDTFSPMTYIILRNPLFYGMGIDSLGFPEKTWIDPKEDGVNGNEHPTYLGGQSHVTLP